MRELVFFFMTNNDKSATSVDSILFSIIPCFFVSPFYNPSKLNRSNSTHSLITKTFLLPFFSFPPLLEISEISNNVTCKKTNTEEIKWDQKSIIWLCLVENTIGIQMANTFRSSAHYCVEATNWEYKNQENIEEFQMS